VLQGGATSVVVLQGSRRRRAPWSRGAEALCCRGAAAAACLEIVELGFGLECVNGGDK
jgi:hypothetical protein